jgi:lycopene cyclase domain-containing protein
MSGYALFLVLALGLPLAVGLLRGGFSWRKWGVRIGAMVAVSVLAGFAWDAYAIAKGFWSLDPGHTLGIAPAGIPIEEWAFYALEALAVAVVSARALERGGA